MEMDRAEANHLLNAEECRQGLLVLRSRPISA